MSHTDLPTPPAVPSPDADESAAVKKIAIMLLLGITLVVVFIGVMVTMMLGAASRGSVSDDPNRQPSARNGAALYQANCMSCHGMYGTGMPRQGSNLVGTPFITGNTDEQLIQFLRAGRRADAPDSQMNLNMPAKGGNTRLTDADLRDIVLFMRELNKEGNK